MRAPNLTPDDVAAELQVSRGMARPALGVPAMTRHAKRRARAAERRAIAAYLDGWASAFVGPSIVSPMCEALLRHAAEQVRRGAYPRPKR